MESLLKKGSPPSPPAKKLKVFGKGSGEEPFFRKVFHGNSRRQHGKLSFTAIKKKPTAPEEAADLFISTYRKICNTLYWMGTLISRFRGHPCPSLPPVMAITAILENRWEPLSMVEVKPL